MEILIIGALAVWEVVEIWRHSALMATWRARVDYWEGRVGQLLSCPFCLAPWIAFLVVLIMWTSDYLAQTVHGAFIFANVPVYALAVARLANLGNDLTHGYCRTPKADQFEDDDEDEDTEQSD